MNTNSYPLICTRGVICFPGQEIVIDVGRESSLRAIENAQDNFNDKIVMFSQIHLDVENPGMKDLHSMGTLCEIRHVRRFDKFLRVKFRGIERVRMKDITEETSLSWPLLKWFRLLSRMKPRKLYCFECSRMLSKT